MVTLLRLVLPCILTTASMLVIEAFSMSGLVALRLKVAGGASFSGPTFSTPEACESTCCGALPVGLLLVE